MILGPERSGKTNSALKITAGSRTYIAHPAEVIKDCMLDFIPSATEKLIIEGAETLLINPEKLLTAMTLSWVNGHPAPEMILTCRIKKDELPEFLVANERIILVDLWSQNIQSV